jgi:putative transcription factor
MNCEICGRRIQGKPTQISIERSVLTVCLECSRFGVPVDKKTAAKIEMSIPRPGIRRPIPAPAQSLRKDQLGEFLLVDDFGPAIRKARESIGMTREDFAKKLGEKDSVIRRVESGEMYPTAELMGKIERLLKIRLKATVDTSVKGSAPSPSNLTLGDVAILREGRNS